MGCTQGSHWPLSFRRSGDADTDTSSPQRSWRAGGAQSEVTEYVEGTQMSKIITPDHTRRNTIEGPAPLPLLFLGDMQSPADYREDSSKDRAPARSGDSSRSSGRSDGGAGEFASPKSREGPVGKENSPANRSSISAFIQFIEEAPRRPSLSASPQKMPSVTQTYVDTLRKRKQEELQRSQESKHSRVAGAEELIRQSLTTPFSGLSLREPLSPEE